MTLRRLFQTVLAALVLTLIFACAWPSNPKNDRTAPANNPGVDRTDVLLYAGASAWIAEVNSIASILYQHGATYQRVTSSHLDEMSIDDLMRFRLFIIAGGYAPTITSSLSSATHERLRAAVRERGLNYLGFCAGAWLSTSNAGEGIGFIDGVLKATYLQNEGKRFALARAMFPNGSSRHLLWYGGPVTPDVQGGVVARYPDGTPAISQISSGRGLVIVSGFHPAATSYILRDLSLTDVSAVAPEFAWELLVAGIYGRPLRSF